MGQRVRTAAPGGDWRSLTATCVVSGGHSQYDIIKIGDTVCVVYFEESVDLGDVFYPIYHCDKIMLDKQTGTGESFKAGDKVYWSGTNGDPVTSVYQSGYYWIAIATEDADEDDELVEVDLKGDKASLTEPL
ncbi:MAG: DUF2190 family protein [Acidobacteriota bacterium]